MLLILYKNASNKSVSPIILPLLAYVVKKANERVEKVIEGFKTNM